MRRRRCEVTEMYALIEISNQMLKRPSVRWRPAHRWWWACSASRRLCREPASDLAFVSPHRHVGTGLSVRWQPAHRRGVPSSGGRSLRRLRTIVAVEVGLGVQCRLSRWCARQASLLGACLTHPSSGSPLMSNVRQREAVAEIPIRCAGCCCGRSRRRGRSTTRMLLLRRSKHTSSR